MILVSQEDELVIRHHTGHFSYGVVVTTLVQQICYILMVYGMAHFTLFCMVHNMKRVGIVGSVLTSWYIWEDCSSF